MDAVQLTRAVKVEARRLGFDFCRIASVDEAAHADFFDVWLAQGRAGEMAYLERNADKRRNPALLAEGAEPDDESFRTIIVLAVNHFQLALPAETRDDPSRGIIASYAWGDDYHEIIRPQLHALDAFIAGLTGRTTRGKCLVDTGPVLERDRAMRAGIGFTGKNCCTIHPNDGSWLLLATVMTPEALLPDPGPAQTRGPLISAEQVAAGLAWNDDLGAWSFPETEVLSQYVGAWLAPARSSGRPQGSPLPRNIEKVQTEDENDRESFATGACGRCTRCLDACPTGAFIGPFHLDPQRCISYWTIESRSPIPRELRPTFGNRIFGCDICQEVCPWNQRLEERQPRLSGLQTQPARLAPPLLEGFSPDTPYWLDQTAFSTRFRRSPIKRAKRAGMLRNVCVALGNWADPSTVPALQLALADEHPLARGHAAWALGQVFDRHQVPLAATSLEKALAVETDPWVIEEIHLACKML